MNIKKNKILQKFEYIDALRGVAILLVIFHHTPHAWHKVRDYFLEIFTNNIGQMAFQFYDNIVGYSAHGVQIFYLVSAFTLFNSLYKRNESKPFIKFFIRRFFRIAPMFYFYIGVVAIVYLFLQIALFQNNELNAHTIFSLMTFTNGTDPTLINFIKGGWSIVVEMTFYLFIPFLFLVIKNLKTAFIFTVLIFIGVLFFLKFLLLWGGNTNPDLWNTFVFSSFPSQLPVFLLGIILFFLLHQKNIKYKIISYVFYLCCTIAYFFAQFYFPEIQFFTIAKMEHHLFLVGVFLVHFIFILAHFPFRILVNRFTIFIGQLSFSIYLWHLGIIDILNHYGLIAYIEQGVWNPLVVLCIKYVVILSITIVLAFITFHLVEKPGISVGKVLVKKL